MIELTVSQRSVNRLAYTNIITVIVILSVTCFGSQVSERLSVIDNPLFVTKLLCSFLVIVNLSLAAGLDKDATAMLKSSKPTRFQVTKLVRGAFQLCASCCVAHVIAVLFGAPITLSVSETFHLASLLAATTVLPCLCVIGAPMSAWIAMRNRQSNPLEWSVQLSAVGAVVGAWLGAFPIPLDWDRPWQIWPVSCIIGTVLGYSVALLASSCSVVSCARRQRKSKAG